MGGSGGGAAARRVAAIEVLRRPWSLMVLGLLVGLAAAVALAALAGARRTDTAYDRLLEDTSAADAVVFASTEGIFDPDFGPFFDLPYVEAAGTFSLASFPEEAGLFVPTGDWLEGVDRPRVLEGRLPDRDDPDEVVLSKPISDELDPGVGVGEQFTVHLFSRQQEEAGDFAEPEGPTVTLDVVGLTSSPFETSTIATAAGSFFGTPAFLEAYGDEIGVFFNLMVKLENGAADIPQLQADTNRILGQPVPVEDLSENVKRVTNGTDLERSGLALFGLAVALAGILIVGQAVIRSLRAAAGDVPAWRALGFGRREVVMALALPHLVVVLTATLVTTVGAIALSPRFPLGLGRRVDPDVGLHADWLVLSLGVVTLVALLVGAIVITCLRIATAATERQARPSAIVRAMGRIGAPVPARVGAGLALEPGRGRRSLPTRPATFAAIAGVIGVVGALGLGRGIDDAVSHPERFGTNWDVVVENYLEDGGPLEDVTEHMVEDPDFAAVGRLRLANLTLGDAVLPTFSVEALSGSIDFTVLDGREPAAGRELVLGPAAARAQGIEIGDRVTLGDAGRFEVVGLGLVPQTPHSSFDQGGWLHPTTAKTLDLPALTTIGRLVDGVDREAKLAELGEVGGEGIGPITPDPPADQLNLRGVRSLPPLFAGFTVVLALGAIAHVSVSVLRRRRGEVAVLRAVGITPRQAWWCLSWQATTLAVIGLLAGVPLGLALGRTAWRSVAEATPMVYVAPLALLASVLVVPVALLLVNLVAALPGHRAARLKPAEVLRSE